jgi:hypothetical protein
MVWALRVPEAMRQRFGAEITRRDVRPQSGQNDGRLRSSMLLKATNGPHSWHSKS